MDLDFQIILDWWPLILDGFKLTLVIVIGAILLGIPPVSYTHLTLPTTPYV